MSRLRRRGRGERVSRPVLVLAALALAATRAAAFVRLPASSSSSGMLLLQPAGQPRLAPCSSTVKGASAGSGNKPKGQQQQQQQQQQRQEGGTTAGGKRKPAAAAATSGKGGKPASKGKASPAAGGAAGAGGGGAKGKGASPLGSGLAWSLSEKAGLPALDTLAPPLPAGQLLEYERQGHTVTRALCAPQEVADYCKVVRAAFEKEKLDAYRQKVRVLLGPEAAKACRTVDDCEELLEEEVDPDSIPFLQTFNAWRKYADVRRLALAPRFAHVAAQLLGVERVRLYQDSSFLKRDGDGPTRWHSDLAMAPLNTNDFVTMWMPMTEVPPEEEGGTGLAFASRSHRDFALNFWDDPHASNDLSERYPAIDSYGKMVPGDASWHHGWVLHSSAANDSGEDRLAFTLCFVAADAPTLGAKAKHRPDDEDNESYAPWIRDFKPGDRLRDHPLLPLVWGDGRPPTKK